MLDNLPLSLYVHIPWCIKKCPYCDFNSHTHTGKIPESEYIQALIQDFESHLKDISNRPIESIFFGGGTPSLFSGESYDRLLSAIDKMCPLPQNLEITLEANPGASDVKKFTSYRNAGINRLSIGVQSFNDAALKSLGRIHNRDAAHHAILAAREANFDNFNLDIMFGLPNQTINEALNDLEQAIVYQPEHLSWYQLTIEPNTAFHTHPPKLPNDDLTWDMCQQGQIKLASKGYQHYEVSAFSLNRRAKHNLNYWLFGDYIGIGTGAHSKITNIQTQLVTRCQKWQSPKRYLNPAHAYISKQEIVTKEALPFEYMLNALRLTEGTLLKNFALRTGLKLDDIAPQLETAYRSKWLERDPTWLKTTPLGKQFLNNLILLFLEHHD